MENDYADRSRILRLPQARPGMVTCLGAAVGVLSAVVAVLLAWRGL